MARILQPSDPNTHKKVFQTWLEDHGLIPRNVYQVTLYGPDDREHKGEDFMVAFQYLRDEEGKVVTRVVDGEGNLVDPPPEYREEGMTTEPVTAPPRRIVLKSDCPI